MAGRKYLSLMLIPLVLAGCTGTKIANQDALASAAQKAAAESGISLNQAIDEAILALAVARNEGLDFYSPLHIEKASVALEEAKKLRAKGRKGEQETRALIEAMKVGELLAAAHRNRELVEQVLATALEHRKVLLELGTDTILPQGFEKGAVLLGAAIREVEHGDLDKARSIQADTIAWFNEIEGDTLRVQFLNRAKALLEKAADVDADDYAPESWEAAEDAYDRADAFIETNFRDREAVKAIASNAYNEASRAYHLAVEVKKVIGKNPEDIEQYMLGIQQLFNDINQHAGVMDLNALSFAEQSRQLSAAMRDAVDAAKAAKAAAEAAEQIDEPEPVEEIEQPVPEVDVGEPELTSALSGVTETETPAGETSAPDVEQAEQNRLSRATDTAPVRQQDAEPMPEADEPAAEGAAPTEPRNLDEGESPATPEVGIQQDATDTSGTGEETTAQR